MSAAQQRAGEARRALAALALAALAFPACGRTHLTPAAPHLVVAPLQVDFGPAPLGLQLHRQLALTNGGSVPLHLAGATLAGAQARAFLAGTLPSQLEAGASGTLELGFTADAAGPFAARLVLASDDPDEPQLAVPLSGTGAVSGSLQVEPAVLDFGRVGEGTAATRQLLLRSTGTSDLFLADLRFDAATPPAYGLVGSARTPATLPAQSSARLVVRFAPGPGTAGGAGALQLLSSDPVHGLLTVPLTGQINRAPLAVATAQVGAAPPQSGELTTAVGATVLLDGSASTDPDGDLPLGYLWSVTQRPAGSAAQPVPVQAAGAQIVLDQPGLYALALTVTDATGLPSLVAAPLDLRAVPPEQLVVQLVWDQERPDLDLHLLEAGAALGEPGDCGWTNPQPSWFPGGPDQNPHHLGDQLVGYGPETVQWKSPTPGSYDLVVVYKDAHGQVPASTTAHVRVFAFGIQVAELTHALQAAGEVWRAGSVLWPTGQVVLAKGHPGAGAP